MTTVIIVAAIAIVAGTAFTAGALSVHASRRLDTSIGNLYDWLREKL